MPQGGGSASPSDFVDLMAVEPKASKLEVAGVIPPRAEGVLEGGSDDVPRPIDGQNISRAEGHSVDELSGPNSEVPRRKGKAPIDLAGVIDVGDSPLDPALSPREIQDAQNRNTSDAGEPLRENDLLEGFFTRVKENPELNTSLILEEVERLCK